MVALMLRLRSDFCVGTRRVARLSHGLALSFFVILFAAAAPSGSALANSKYAALVANGHTGEIVFSRNADALRYPASLTKIMTLYVLFEELEAGRMTMKTRLKVSRYAASQQPSKIGLKPGATIAVKDAILSLVTKSANDIAVVVAEGVSGSESKFAQRMTRTARGIGMSKTTFKNASGLPNKHQVTTARDMMTLGRAVMHRFPEYYKLFKTRTFSYRGRRYGNHNRLLGSFQGTEGIKTGYTRASGFNLVASVRRGDKLLIGVVMGGKSGRSRNAHMRDILTRSFPKVKGGKPRLYAAKLPSAADAPLPAPRPKVLTPQPVKVASAGAAPMRLVNMPRTVTTIPIPVASVPNAPAAESAVTPATTASTVAAYAPAPAPAPVPVPESAQAQLASDNQIASANPIAGGWVIQIGAFPSQSDAVETLQDARGHAKKILTSAEPFTEPVDKNGSTLWRARFAGFDRQSAKAACKHLKRNDFVCFAARN